MKRIIALLLITTFMLAYSINASAQTVISDKENPYSEAVLDGLVENNLGKTDKDIAQTGASNAISSVAVSGVTEPVSGMKPVFAASVASPMQCFIPQFDSDNSDSIFMKNGVVWTDESSEVNMMPSDVFTAGHDYLVLIALYCNTGYYFNDSLAITINGQPASSRVYSDNYQLAYAYCTFTCKGSSSKDSSSSILGDADCDMAITIMDATRIQRWLAELCDMNGSKFSGALLTSNEVKIADADNDNSVTIMDATAIQRHVADLSAYIGIGKPIDSSEVKVQSITLSSSSLNMNVGDTSTLTATVSPSNADNKSLEWSSSNTSVATVSQNGTITAKSAGTATITVQATDGSGVKKSCLITITLNPDAKYIRNFNNLASYIKNNPTGIDDYGNPYISDYLDGQSGEEYYSITALPSGGLEFYSSLEYNMTTSSKSISTVDFVANFNNSFMISPDFSFRFIDSLLGMNRGCNGSASTDARYYTSNTTLTFSGLTQNENKTANTSTQLAFVNWEILLLTKCNTSMKDIGFKSFE